MSRNYCRGIGWGTLLGFLAASPLWAKPVPVEDVVLAVRGWLALTDAAPMGSQMGNGLSFVAPVTDEQGDPLFYAVSLEKGGVVVMSPDDAIEPVIAFAKRCENILDPDPCNHLRAMLENDLADRLADVREGVTKGTKESGKWALLLEAAKNPLGVKVGLGSVSDVRVWPLTRTKWSQSYVYQGSTRLAVYNYYTPPYTPGSYQNYYCGCVATALAQLMKYFNHPGTGVGTGSYNISVDGTPYTDTLRGGNGSGGRYDWVNMPDDPTALAKAGRLNTTQRKAIGNLCHDAAVASQMKYTYSSSGTYLCWTPGAHPLMKAFKYASTVSPYVASGSTFFKKDINSALNPCLDAGMPCALSIKADKGTGVGHAVLADGYGYANGVLYHHINFGWAGSESAWYNLPTVDSTARSYTRIEGLVFNVHPTQAGISVISGRVVDPAGKPLSGVQVKLKSPLGSKSKYSNTKGIYSFLVKAGNYTITPVLSGYGFKPEERTVTAGYGTIPNSWNNTFKRVTRIMRLSATKLQFGPLPVGSDRSLKIKVFNDGTAPLEVTGIVLPAPFTTDVVLPFTLAPKGGMQEVYVTFTAAALGQAKEEMIFRSNRSSGPNRAIVVGTGI